jgi:hypothetical protein
MMIPLREISQTTDDEPGKKEGSRPSRLYYGQLKMKSSNDG